MKDPFNVNHIPPVNLIHYGFGRLKRENNELNILDWVNLRKTAEELTAMIDLQFAQYPKELLEALKIEAPIDVEYEEVKNK